MGGSQVGERSAGVELVFEVAGFVFGGNHDGGNQALVRQALIVEVALNIVVGNLRFGVEVAPPVDIGQVSAAFQKTGDTHGRLVAQPDLARLSQHELAVDKRLQIVSSCGLALFGWAQIGQHVERETAQLFARDLHFTHARDRRGRVRWRLLLAASGHQD